MKLYAALLLLFVGGTLPQYAQNTQKPVLHGRHWMAITGKPLAATAGAMVFQQGGNAVDAACAMLAATCTMWDVLSWGGETQVLLYHPKLKKVIGLNGLGVAPTGATAQFFKSKGYAFPPQYGPLAAVAPGTPGSICYLLAEYGTKSLKEVLAPSMQLAAGYPIEAQLANGLERQKAMIKEWPYSKAVFLPHLGQQREAPEAGEIFVQQDLLQTLTKMVEAEQQALKQGKTRKQALMAAYDRFYKGDIAREFVRGCQEQGGLITLQDLANWKPQWEEPLMTTYKGIEVFKLQQWTQGPSMLQALNILENFDLKAMKYNSPAYIHTITQAMHLSFADRDFYYGDPRFNKNQPMQGLLSKAYAAERAKLIDTSKNLTLALPGDPYPFEGRQNPYLPLLAKWGSLADTSGKPGNATPEHDRTQLPVLPRSGDAEWAYNPANGVNPAYAKSLKNLGAVTPAVDAAVAEGWVVSITPRGGWSPACIAGRTGVGMSQRLQSFVLDSALNPFNVIAPGKRPRVTLTPTIALKEGKPYLAFGVQGGDTQDQNLLQFFLNMVEFGMQVQQATEAANVNTNQLWLSLGGMQIKDRAPRAGDLLLQNRTPEAVRNALRQKGYTLSFAERTSGPINAIFFDWKHGSLWGGSSNHGEDYGIAW